MEEARNSEERGRQAHLDDVPPIDHATTFTDIPGPSSMDGDRVNSAEDDHDPEEQHLSLPQTTVLYRKEEGRLALSDNLKYLYWIPKGPDEVLPTLVIRTRHISDISKETPELVNARDALEPQGPPSVANEEHPSASPGLSVETPKAGPLDPSSGVATNPVNILRVTGQRRVYRFMFSDAVSGEEDLSAASSALVSLRDRLKARREAKKDAKQANSDSEDGHDTEEAQSLYSDPYVHRQTLVRMLRGKYRFYDPRTKEQVEDFIKQSDAFGWALEALVTEEVRAMRRSQRPAPKKREPSIPVIQKLPWEWWETREVFDTDGVHAAIEVLSDEPSDDTRRRRRPVPPLGTENEGTPYDESLLAFRGAPRVLAIRPLPGRIKIWSVPLRQTLQEIMERVAKVQPVYGSMVMLRPYKALILCEKEIRARFEELESLFKDRSSQTNQDEVDGDAKPSDDDTISVRSLDFSNMDALAKSDLATLRETMEDMRCLIDFMDTTLLPVRAYLRDQPEEVYWHDLWHVFSPGMTVYVRDNALSQKLWKVLQVTGGRRYNNVPLSSTDPFPNDYETINHSFELDCFFLDFDGSKFVYIYRRFEIEAFDKLAVSALTIMPLSAAERLGLVDSALAMSQGQQWLSYTTPQHRYYSGTTISHTPAGEPLFAAPLDDSLPQRLLSRRIESQVVVDTSRALQANPEWGPIRKEPDFHKPDQPLTIDRTENVMGDYVFDFLERDRYLEAEAKKWTSWDKREATPDGIDLLILPQRVFAYILRSRTWACVNINDLQEVKKHEDAWSDLEISHGHKSIVQSLIKTHFAKDKSRDAQFDLVQDKGKGVIILLHGVPGVGKTATAEVVAATEQKPLLPITCGDLGLYPKEVEATLQTSFQLAQAWDCVMLLDEADVFLAQRTNEDIERNALVSVFLRVLEYYEGVLFLTTNRVGAFDEAFKSRIHMALYYPPLKLSQTTKIWQSQIRRARERSVRVECNEEQLLAYAEELYQAQQSNLDFIGPVWNGRQIRNAFQSAIALARNDSSKAEAISLETRHFKVVAQVSDEFNQYIWKVKSGRTDADIARETGARDDAFSAGAYQRSRGHAAGSSLGTPMPMRYPTPSSTPYSQYGTPAHNVPQPAPYTSPFAPKQPPPPAFGMPGQGFGQQQAQPYQQQLNSFVPQQPQQQYQQYAQPGTAAQPQQPQQAQAYQQSQQAQAFQQPQQAQAYQQYPPQGPGQQAQQQYQQPPQTAYQGQPPPQQPPHQPPQQFGGLPFPGGQVGTSPSDQATGGAQQ